ETFSIVPPVWKGICPARTPAPARIQPHLKSRARAGARAWNTGGAKRRHPSALLPAADDLAGVRAGELAALDGHCTADDHRFDAFRLRQQPRPSAGKVVDQLGLAVDDARRIEEDG